MTAPRLHDVCGNLLLAAELDLADDELRGSSALARHCFAAGRRIADGIAVFARRDGWVRSCFFNPDGSFERVCGNSLFVAGALLGEGEHVVRPFDHADVLVVNRAGRISASSVLPDSHTELDLGARGVARLLDTGSPHAVVEVADARSCDLVALRAALAAHDVNVTAWSAASGIVSVRTFERGVFAETRACGTGAIAVALAQSRLDEPIEIRYSGGSYAAGVERSAQGVRWTLSVASVAVSVK